MNGTWYCTDCEEEIEKGAIDAHEADDHHVKGFFRPDRLLPGDPELIGAQAGSEGPGGER
ncbi:hypothetical protein DM826_06265 [Halonotius aquaticus]|jgi:hypothetical protein|uniref:Uncharacterized protein n=1 Tax=Halonotius aquaticus TaxID=2216978 RepID=A0A3A6PY96_9EURY|nr:hypothetical protein [Halonotius aquaticus]RJX43213.1 hypothetical protein DM826_06265 [Halonotius aquaticus]